MARPARTHSGGKPASADCPVEVREAGEPWLLASIGGRVCACVVAGGGAGFAAGGGAGGEVAKRDGVSAVVGAAVAEETGSGSSQM